MNNMKLIMENWRGFQGLTEVTSLKESEILVETRTMKLTLEELDKSYKAKKITKQSYQKTLRESIIYDFRMIQKYIEENKQVLSEEKWDDDNDVEYKPKEKDPNSFMSRMGAKFASGWLSMKKKVLESVFKFFKLIGTSKDGHLNWVGKAAKKVAKFNDRFKKDHPIIHGAIKALIILAITLAISKFIAGAAGLDAAAERVGRTAIKGGAGGLKDAIPMPPETKEPAELLMSLDPEAGQHPVIQACVGGGKASKEALASLPDHVDKVTDKAAAAADAAGMKADTAKQIARETRRKVQAAVAEKAGAAADVKGAAADKVAAAGDAKAAAANTGGGALSNTRGLPRGVKGINPDVDDAGGTAADTKAGAAGVATDTKAAAVDAKANAAGKATDVKTGAAEKVADKPVPAGVETAEVDGKRYPIKPDPASGRTIKVTAGTKEVYVSKDEMRAMQAADMEATGTTGMEKELAAKAKGGAGAAADTKAAAVDTKAAAADTKAAAVDAKASAVADAKPSVPQALKTPWKSSLDDVAKEFKDPGATAAKLKAEVAAAVPSEEAATKDFKSMMGWLGGGDGKRLAIMLKVRYMDGRQGFQLIDKLTEQGLLKPPAAAFEGGRIVDHQMLQDWKWATLDHMIKISDALDKVTTK